MSARNVGIVFRKELKDVLRDRRTVISMIVVPVLLLPALILGMGAFTSRMVDRARQETVKVALAGAEEAPELAARLRAVERFEVTEAPTDLREQISGRQLRAAVEIPPGFAGAVTAGQPAQLLLLYHQGDLRSEMAAADIRRTASEYNSELVAERLTARGVDPAVLEPFSVEQHNVASREQVSGRTLGGLVPYLIIFMLLIGSMYPAIDLTAGEKERGTIETILVSSVSRLDLVLGKFLTICTASLATAVMSLVALAVTAFLIVPWMAGGGGDGGRAGFAGLVEVSPTGLVAMVGLLAPLAVLFSALVLAICLFAKSYKEAQSYLSPLMIVVIIPAVMAMLPGFELTWQLSLVPVVGTSLASKELLAGSFDWGLLALIFASTCLYAAVAIFWAFRQFQREEVLFRS